MSVLKIHNDQPLSESKIFTHTRAGL